MGITAGIAVVGAVAGGVSSADQGRRGAHAAQDAASYQEQQLNQAISYQNPYAEAGTAALNRVQAGTKQGGEFYTNPYQQLDPNNLTGNKTYQFLQDEAQKAIMRQRSTSGGGVGGSTLKALQDRSQNVAGTYYNDMETNNLNAWKANFAGTTANLGAQQDIVNKGFSAASNISNLTAGIGQAGAEGMLGAAAAKNQNDPLQGAISGASSLVGAYTGLKSPVGGSSSGIGGTSAPANYSLGGSGAKFGDGGTGAGYANPYALTSSNPNLFGN